MLPVSEELKEKLQKLNDSLKHSFPLYTLDRMFIREKLEQLGSFYTIKKYSHNDLDQWLQGHSVIGIDGSVNTTKGVSNRSVSVFQALALGTHGEEKWEADIYTPLLETEHNAEDRGSMLANLELKLAYHSLNEWNAMAVLMDGSLLHFYIDSPDSWGKVGSLAQTKGVYIVGVAEEISTNRLVKELFPEYTLLSDRDILYGVLQYGEVFEWDNWSPVGSNMWRTAFRSSLSPDPILVDGLNAQREEKINLLKLIFSLTPEQGRGIPFWLDIVDSQVRVTDSLVQTMVEQYIDPDLRQRLFSSKRKERII